MNIRIVAAKTFPGSKGKSALADAAAWLSEQCAGGWSPLAVVVTGSDARATVSGTGGGALVLAKK